MTDVRWLSRRMVEAFHGEAIDRFGGLEGLRDEGMLEAALARPRNLAAYADAPSLFELAAVYCAGIIADHPFVDGNKRAGLIAARVFLSLNGYRFDPNERDAVTTILALAAGAIDEAALATWLSDYSTRIGGRS